MQQQRTIKLIIKMNFSKKMKANTTKLIMKIYIKMFPKRQ